MLMDLADTEQAWQGESLETQGRALGQCRSKSNLKAYFLIPQVTSFVQRPYMKKPHTINILSSQRCDDLNVSPTQNTLLQQNLNLHLDRIQVHEPIQDDIKLTTYEGENKYVKFRSNINKLRSLGSLYNIIILKSNK